MCDSKNISLPCACYKQRDNASSIFAKAAAGKSIRLINMPDNRTGFISTGTGVLRVNKEALIKINSIEGISFSTLHGNHVVTAETSVAETMVIIINEDGKNLKEAEDICKEFYPVIEIKPFRNLRVGVITTGNEIFSGRIKDKFGPILKEKFLKLNCEVIKQLFVPDDVEKTVDAINELVSEGADLIALTGGMSVDPDDLTPLSIKKAGARIVTYGVPVYPGGMFLLAYLRDIPVLGLPGCVMYHRASIFDLVLPLIIAGETVTREYVLTLGHGGFCARCEECHYPVCGFGKQ
jgi:molybdenum cofactor synthesis domain-containing protein